MQDAGRQVPARRWLGLRASELIVNQASAPPATARVAQASIATWKPWTIADGS